MKFPDLDTPLAALTVGELITLLICAWVLWFVIMAFLAIVSDRW